MVIMNWLMFSIITIICWGLWGFFTKLASAYLNWHQIFLVTNTISFAVSLLIFIVLKPSINVSSSGFNYALIAGLMGSLALISFNVAIKEGKAIIVVPLTALYPVVTAVLSYLILHEEITLTKGLGITLALVAIVLVSME